VVALHVQSLTHSSALSITKVTAAAAKTVTVTADRVNNLAGLRGCAMLTRPW